MVERDCPRCGTPVLHGTVECFADVTLSRRPIKRDRASALMDRGVFVALVRRGLTGRVISKLWDPWSGASRQWTALLRHECEGRQ